MLGPYVVGRAALAFHVDAPSVCVHGARERRVHERLTHAVASERRCRALCPHPRGGIGTRPADARPQRWRPCDPSTQRLPPAGRCADLAPWAHDGTHLAGALPRQPVERQRQRDRRAREEHPRDDLARGWLEDAAPLDRTGAIAGTDAADPWRRATGVLFSPLNAENLVLGVERVAKLAASGRLPEVQKRLLSLDVSWDGPAQSWAAVLADVVNEAKKRP